MSQIQTVYNLKDEINKLIDKCIEEKKDTIQSAVDHPKYYLREGAIECIDEMELVFGPEATANYCLLNCWKYRYRAGLKNNGYEDLEKSDWYMRKYKELKEKIEKNTHGSFTIKSSNITAIPCATTPCSTTAYN